MSLSEEGEKGNASKMSLSVDIKKRNPADEMNHDSEAKMPNEQKRPASPVPSCVSMKSDRSMNPPLKFREEDFSTEQRPNQQERPASPVPNCVSMESDWTIDPTLYFIEGDFSTKQRPNQQERPASPVPNCVSMESDWTIDPTLYFIEGDFSTKQRPNQQERPASPVPNCVSMESDWTIDPTLYFIEGDFSTKQRPNQQERPASPVPNCVSMESDWTIDPTFSFIEGDFSTEQRPNQQERPASPVPSCMSMKSNLSMNQPLNFRKGDFSTEQRPNQQERPASPVPNCVSMESDWTIDPTLYFIEGDFSTEQRPNQQERPDSPVPNCVSMESDWTIDPTLYFIEGDFSTKQRPNQQERPASPVPNCVSMKSNRSMGRPYNFQEGDFSTEQREQQERSESEILSGQSVQSHQTDLSSRYSSDEKQESSAKDRKNMNQKELADTLEKSQTLLRLQHQMKTKLKKKYEMICEGSGQHENQTLLKDIYTELYITEGGSKGVNEEHEVRQIEMASKRQTTPATPIKCNDIFKPIKQHQNKGVRRNLTKGIAGIGKTVSVQKVILDWAEEKANQDVHLIFPLPFRDLNLKKDQYSLMQLISHYFPELQEINRIEDGLTKTYFIFDGLDECRLPLDFKNNKKCCDVTEPTSVDVLLTNLIEGNLLPSALLWITTRPAAANRIPPECVDQVTEIRGFNEPQKEEYFRKKITDQNLANEIIKHIKTCRSLHIMCHIPVFCWISATVLETMLNEAKKEEIPKTLTQMYEHFLLIQTSMKNKKYNKSTETNPKELSQSDKDMILKLSKLAFQQLQKGNLIFYEEDLRECGIVVSEASEYSALCTEIFKEEYGLYQEKVFSFVHLTIQEFLAAVHVLESCLSKEEHVFPPTQNPDWYYNEQMFTSDRRADRLSDLHRRAVDQALKSKNGHLDLFLRFLLGLSLESNQNLLQGILTQTGSTTQSNEETVKRTVEYLSDIIMIESSPERIINLFHCLNELGANSLVEDIQTSLRSGTLSETELQPHQCSALAYLLLMSEEVLEEFDMKTYKTSKEGYRRLLPVVKTCKRAILSSCGITEEDCASLVSAVKSNPSHLKELDLSYNQPEDSGVIKLSALMEDPQCRLETLKLSGCGITEKGGGSLVSALKSNPSHLKELDLSNNVLKDSGVKLLSAMLDDPQCRLETLRLSGCRFKEEGCRSLASTLKSNSSNLKKLDLSDNDLANAGVQLLFIGLVDPNCKLESLRLSFCGVTEEGCDLLASALMSNSCHLRELDLSNNDLGNSGAKCLSSGLGNPHCKLETLRLSGCLVTEEGCGSLVSGLKSNPSHMKELDLSYNHPGDLGVRLLSAGLKDPHWRLEKLNMDHGGEWRLKSRPKRYVCDLTLDPITVNRFLRLSEEDRKVTRGTVVQPYPDHPERFEYRPQVLCRESLSGRCYWEVEWSGREADIGVTYKGINRRGRGDDSCLGDNDKSWCLYCVGNSYSVRHNNMITVIPVTSLDSHRVGVYLDWSAGTLSFYRVSSDTLTHLYTFNTTFTEPLYPGFYVYNDSSVSLCHSNHGHVE
ncbi:NACHT, LRR and PYD domains-containing protein 12-like [Esox lucius]|uniref:NACHT, LRR and PYD domains-containing protein 12-like n=1 Tax=Esox lucius TaxID=8010 RepID=UPI0014771E82|nr:NACHT, LRR and PYD domains-containing protein 12-like [Esox lucius]